MLNVKEFGNELKRLGYDFYSGVPCSFLKDLINYAINDCEYVMAVNEGDAVAICAGAHLGGRKTVFLCQNSGLTNATSPLTSLNYSFRLPVLGFVSLRGEEGLGDEPQHELMGRITTDMLDTMGIPWQYLSSQLTEAKEQLQHAEKHIASNQTFFFVVKKGTFQKEPLESTAMSATTNLSKKVKTGQDQLPKRLDALSVVNSFKDDETVLLATTGLTGRELYEIEDAPNNLYMVGSMGCVSSLGLGLAVVRPDKKIVAIDGDGSLLMRMGSMATNAAYSPPNMLHILLDNNCHDSTGGQSTVSHCVNFVDVAAATGYTRACHAHSLEEFEVYLEEWSQNPVLTFLYLKIDKGKKDGLGRPKVSPEQVKDRLMEFLRNR